MNPNAADTAAVIVAAGRFTRMQGIPKLRVLLAGRPVIAHTLAAFQNTACIREIVTVAREDDMLFLKKVCREYGFTKVSAIVPGGDTRQGSVAKGIAALTAGARYVAVHDGARPLATPAMIARVAEAAHRFGAAAAAVRVKDTVKLSDSDDFIERTPPRDRLWNVQTPQIFERTMYEQALQSSLEKGYDFTDDCQLVEQTGRPVYLCEADYANLKITTPEDIAVADALLRLRRAEKEIEICE